MRKILLAVLFCLSGSSFAFAENADVSGYWLFNPYPPITVHVVKTTVWHSPAVGYYTVVENYDENEYLSALAGGFDVAQTSEGVVTASRTLIDTGDWSVTTTINGNVIDNSIIFTKSAIEIDASFNSTETINLSCSGTITTDPPPLSFIKYINYTYTGTYSYSGSLLDAICDVFWTETATFSGNFSATVMKLTSPLDTFIISGPTGTIHTKNVEFQWTGTDSEGAPAIGYYYQMDSQPEVYTTDTSKTFNDLSLGEHTFSVAAKDNSGNVDSTPATCTFTIEENPPQVASFKLLKVDGSILEKPMVGGNIGFDASESYDPDGTIVSYEWDFGDGTPVETLSVPGTSHVFTKAEDYNVKLTVKDNMGQTATITKPLPLSLRIGDIFLCRTDNSYVPGRTWGHAGIYAGKRDFDGADVIIEGLLEPDGAIVVSPITRWSWPEMTNVCVLRPEVEYWQAQAAVDFASSQIGRPFDSWRITKQAGHITDKVWNAPSWYCSELVWAAYMNATNGLCDLDNPNLNGNAIAPDEIYYSPRVQLIGEHKEDTPETFWSFYRLIGGVANCPVELSITDSSGRHIEVNANEIPGGIYEKGDFNGDGEMDVFFAIPNPKTGDYKITVIADSNALPTDTYSLTAIINGQTMVLAQDVQIQDIPSQPYKFESKLNRSDFDNDGDVDFYDYAAFASRWMSADCHYPDWCEGKDLDYSGLVDFIDLSIFTENWLWEKIPADIDIDGDVDFVDYAVFANNWMNEKCADPNWCEGTDFDHSGSVDMLDLATFADNWLAGL